MRQQIMKKSKQCQEQEEEDYEMEEMGGDFEDDALDCFCFGMMNSEESMSKAIK